MFILLSVVLWEHVCVIAESTPPQRLFNQVAVEIPSPDLIIDSVCAAILSGDFAGAREIVYESTDIDCVALRQFEMIIDEYMAIEARR